MKKSKQTVIVMMITMILSILMIYFLEWENLAGVRKIMIGYLPFFSGKRSILSNIFLGIFASALCMSLGEIVVICTIVEDTKREINRIFDRIEDEIDTKKGQGRNEYIRMAAIMIGYKDKVDELYQNRSLQKEKQKLIISELQLLMDGYYSIYINDRIKKGKIQLFKELNDEIHKNIEIMREALKNIDKQIEPDDSEYNMIKQRESIFESNIERKSKEMEEHFRDLDDLIDKCILGIDRSEERLKKIRKL